MNHRSIRTRFRQWNPAASMWYFAWIIFGFIAVIGLVVVSTIVFMNGGDNPQ